MTTTRTLTGRVSTGSTRTPKDRAALSTLIANGVPEEEIVKWSYMGPLSEVVRLDNVNFPLEVAQKFPPHKDLLKTLANSLGTIKSRGIDVHHLANWHLAEVYQLRPQYVIESRWQPWRAVAIDTLGFKAASLAAAAGLSPNEARTMAANGEWNEDTLEVMAALRSSR